MAQRGRATQKKRQREMANKERQRIKVQRREERRSQALRPPESDFATLEEITGLDWPSSTAA